ncbi:MAG TPA: hypothetical protein VK988_11975 [Acidimicrobiales bacterium]|nr:hypothetical protein [Acidimicrobiales bacterium]
MSDGTALAEALLGLPGFRVLEVVEDGVEVVIGIETLAEFAGCAECGARAEAHDRMSVEIRDLACFGRAARLVWHRRGGAASMPTAKRRRGPRRHRTSRPARC